MSHFIITGSTKGIGNALAREALVRGHHVLLSGRSQAGVDAALQGLEPELRQRALGRVVDVSDKAQVANLWDVGMAAWGQVDVWINNAGVAHTTQRIEDFASEDVQRMVHTNMFGTIHGCQVAAAGMRKQGHGRIFNILGGGSDGEYFPGMGIYGSTKRGLDYLTRALVKELKDSAVLVGRVRPGLVVTQGMLREVKADPDNFERSRKFMNILGDKPETVAPYLIDRMLAMKASGGKIAWLSGPKIAKRFALARLRPRPDLFAETGL